MALGSVITAKGKRMDFAALVRKARKPIQTGPEMKSEVVRQKPPAKEMRAVGNMPPHTGVRHPVAEAAPAVTRPIETKSLADYTEIKIDEAKHLKDRPDDAQQSANEALQEILSSDRAAFSRGGVKNARKA